MGEEIQNAQILNVLSRLTVYSLSTVLNIGCAILLLRTAAGLRKSRFLRHLAVSLFINVGTAIVSITHVLLRAKLASVVTNPAEPSNEVVQIWNTLRSTHAGITTILSLLSTWYLFAAWNLLRRYPNEGVDRSLFTILTACFGTGGLLVVTINLLNVFERTREHLWLVLKGIDLLSSAVGLLLIGWQFQKTLGPNMRTENAVYRAMIPFITFLAYSICGVSQLFHELLKEFSWYSTLLVTTTFGAIIMTIILCSQALEEKPEYSSTPKSG